MCLAMKELKYSIIAVEVLVIEQRSTASRNINIMMLPSRACYICSVCFHSIQHSNELGRQLLVEQADEDIGCEIGSSPAVQSRGMLSWTIENSEKVA